MYLPVFVIFPFFCNFSNSCALNFCKEVMKIKAIENLMFMTILF